MQQTHPFFFPLASVFFFLCLELSEPSKVLFPHSSAEASSDLKASCTSDHALHTFIVGMIFILLDGEDKSLGLLLELRLVYICRVERSIICKLLQNKPDAICPGGQPSEQCSRVHSKVGRASGAADCHHGVIWPWG